MEFSSWLALVAICVVGAISPGPSLAVVMRNTLAGGRAYGVRTAIGHGSGVGLYALLTALGLALVIANNPVVFNGIRYGGAAFLAWLGIKALLAKPKAIEQSKTQQMVKHRGAFEGFMVAFLNPQLAIFFVALFSQFVNANTSWQQSLVMMVTAGGIDGAWYVLVALVLSRGPVLAWLNAKSLWLDRLSAVVLLALAFTVML
ncbi:LysE family translocator [Oceanisphaera avium]|uniref:Lysine transporter LysE n=1 Tax=Oceanisphaera avium TaxID=1903694 RepID=A0A1Y0CZ61_9GAMM|nr:LysE family translocator [Oceanisphaera avium]ART80602.1 lysine transporter LysE [Oceanisphaera avium]